MIIVTGTIHARADTLDEVLTKSVEHVHRSRTEHGCLLHTVHQDVEDPLRVVFVEHWSDLDALLEHFAVPASAQFARDVTALAAAPPDLRIYEAEPVTR